MKLLFSLIDTTLKRPRRKRSSKDEAVYDTRAERVKHKVRQDLISFSPSNSSGTQCTTHSADSQLSAECPPPGHSLTTGGQQKQSVPLPAASSETAGLSDPPASSSDYSLQQQYRSDETAAAAADTDLCDSEPQRDVTTTSTCTSTATASTTTVGHSSFAQQLERRQSEERRLQDCVDKLQQQLNSAQSSLNKSRLMGELSTSSLLLTTAELLLLAKQTEKEGQALRRERDEARAEVASLETMFSDLHRRYDRTKQMLSEKCIECEQRGEQLKDALEHVTREAHKYDMLQQYAESTILQTRADIDGERKSHQAELLALSARLKLAVHKETKLEQENQELTALCDELIQKMGAPR